MIKVTFNSADAFLLDDQPNWSTPVSVDASLPSSYERGLSGRETRRPTGDTLRLAVKYSANLTTAAAVTNLRNSLQALNVQPVLCPFWPAGFVAGAAPTVTAAFYALFNDDGSYSSIAAAAGLPFAKTAYPLMVGILPEIPDPTLTAGGSARVDFQFMESDASALTLPAFVPPVGIAAAAGVRPLFPFRPDWDRLPMSGASEVDIQRQQIGQGRALESAYYAQPGRRRLQQDFTLQNSDPINLLAFFANEDGEQNNFWLPAALTEAALTQNVLATDSALHVDDAGAVGTNAFALLDDSINRVLVKITGTSGSQWNLSAAVGTAFAMWGTRIESLLLARFDALKITLDFATPTMARAQLKFKETPWEITAVGGETIGVTMGALPTTAILFVFTLSIPSGPMLTYFTNFERNLDDGTNTYLTAAMEFDKVNETATLERQSVNLKARNFSGNPLAMLIPFELEWPLLVDIYEADVTWSAVPTIATLQTAGRCLFSGEVSSADIDPPFINAKCDSMRSIFDRQIPRRLYQPTCNWVLFETACTMVPANWQWDAVVVSYNAATSSMVIGTITSSNGATLAAHFFAAGFLKTTHGSGPSAVTQYRSIGDSTVLSGGQITVSLSAPFASAPVAGDVLNLFPGCDGRQTTCANKFSNYSNFGGFPFMPVGNPSTLKINTSSGGAGKK